MAPRARGGRYRGPGCRSQLVTWASPATFGEPRNWLRPTDHKLAVVGAEGFIGSHVVVAALRAGACVTALTVNDVWRLRGLEHPRLRIQPVGARWWESAGRVSDASAVVLLAYTPPPSRAASEWRRHEDETNVAGTLRWASAAAGARVVLASSADVYGRWSDHPATESTVTDPATPYAAAKLRAERAVSAAAPTIVLRIATAYGALENGPRAIPSFIRAFASGRRPVIHNGGADVRDYIHVADV